MNTEEGKNCTLLYTLQTASVLRYNLAMRETTSPLGRFVAIVEKLHLAQIANADRLPQSNSSTYDLGGIICDALGINADESKYSPLEMMLGYQTLLTMGFDARIFLEKHSRPRSKQINLQYLYSVLEIIIHNNIYSPYSVLHDGNSLPKKVFNDLLALNDNFSAYNIETILSDSDIHTLTEIFDELSSGITELSIDTLLKDRIIMLLNSIRMQLNRINMVGTEEVMKSLDELLGQSVRVASSGNTEEKKTNFDFFVKCVDVVSKVQNLVDSAQKMYPALEAAARAFGVLPQ
jgi:hypothetical protein